MSQIEVRRVEAVLHIRRMCGGSQSQLMKASDEHFYVVKFRNNPQHVRVLANELFISTLASHLGLPVPRGAVIHVSRQLIKGTPELRIELPSGSTPCVAGLQYGSLHVADRGQVRVFDYLPETQVRRVSNLNTFAGILVLDEWVANSDQRQAIFWRSSEDDGPYHASFVDHGHCFNCGKWNFSQFRGTFPGKSVYEHVRGWDDFEPWLSAVENMDRSTLWECARGIPASWCGREHNMTRLVDELLVRRSQVAGLIAAFRDSAWRPFPNWNLRLPSVARLGAHAWRGRVAPAVPAPQARR